MKEKLSTPTSRLEQAIDTIRTIVSPDWLPYFYTNKHATILHTLQEVVRDVPGLEPLATAVIQNELLEIQRQHNRDMPLRARITLPRVIKALPPLSKSILNEPLFDHQELFLLEHDTTTSFSNVILKVYTRHRNILPIFDTVDQRTNNYSRLRYRYDETIKNHLTPLTHAYAKLMKEYVVHAVLPTMQKTLQMKLPIGTFELYELRSAYRELVGVDPTTWAVSLPLRTTLKQFVQSQTFHDKNTQKPVEVQFAEDCANPLVFIDPGDLFRMTRNLLRDAVTHGEGPTITPIIHIKVNDGVVEYSIYSPGYLDSRTLAVIGRQPYTTRDRGDTPHGYGKVGARKLLTALWKSLGASPTSIESLLKHHWSNTTLGGYPFVRWTAPLPIHT